MTKHHVEHRPHEFEVPDSAPLDPVRLEREEDERSLDLVQRVVVSALALVVGGSISFVLAIYTATTPDALDRASALGLWVMTGVTGLLTAVVVLAINRRHAYSPLLLLGLLPMALSAYWVLGPS